MIPTRFIPNTQNRIQLQKQECMKLSFTIFTLILFTATTTLAQVVYEPQILILAPNKIKYDTVFNDDLVERNKALKAFSNEEEVVKLEQFLSSPKFKTLPDKLQKQFVGNYYFTRDLDFFSSISIMAHRFLTWDISERFKNLLINLKYSKSNGTLQDLKKFSESEDLQYVLNFPSINLYKENGISKVDLSVQLYDNVTDSILLDKTYTGDWNNPAFTYGCQDKSIECTINNALSQVVKEIRYIVALRSPTLIRERQLAQERFDTLVQFYLFQPYDKDALHTIITPSDTTATLGKLYQILYSPDSSKFIAFYSDRVSDSNYRSAGFRKRDKSSSSSLDEKASGNDNSWSYAYIIKGIKYNNRWFYIKEHTTYFEANDDKDGQQKFFNKLQSWGFFKENTTIFNPGFWEGKLFEKVVDLRKEPDWEKYKTIYTTDERKNRPYIGLYKLVAETIKQEKYDSLQSLDKDFIRLFILPFANRLKAQNRYDNLLTFSDGKDYPLIYPPNRNVIIFPIPVHQNGADMYFRYFVFILQKDNAYRIYEWHYLKPSEFRNENNRPNFMKQINTLTEWNYSYDYVEDEKFWNDYVLAKSGNSYVYLTEIK